MTRKLTENQLKELEYLKEECLFIIDFLTKRTDHTSTFKKFTNVMVDTFEKKNLKGLKILLKDTKEWAKGLSEEDYKCLYDQLEIKFGGKVNKQDNERSNRINIIVKRAKINNDDEYDLLLSKVEEIFEDDGKKDELNKLNELLAEYHTRKK